MAFIGRERELARLSAALQRAAEGTPTRLVLRAPTGAGTSALLDELQTRLGDVPGVVVARGRAFESAAGAAYFALAEALDAALARLPDHELARVVGAGGHDLAVLIPVMEARLARLGIATAEPPLVAPDQRGSRVVESVIGAIERLGRDGVVLLVLEDLHWADPATRAFVEGLLRISRRLPLCLVVTYDPDEFHRRHPGRPLVRTLESSATAEVLSLQPLDRDDLAAFAEAIIGERPAASLLAALLEGSGGNPLLASQLLAAHASADGFRRSEGFEAVMQARLAALPVQATRVLQVLAAARRPLPRLPLLRLALPGGRLTAAGVAEAIGSGLAAEAPEHTGPDRVGVPHPLVIEAIERTVSAPERQALHHALADELAETPAERAWHLEAAMDFSAAREAHLAAGRAAELVDPGDSALLHFERALELSSERIGPSTRDPSDTAEVLEHAAAAAFSARSFRRAATHVQQAIAIRSSRASVAAAAERGHDATRDLQRTVGELHERLGRYRWGAGDAKPAFDAFEKALELIPVDPSRARAHALASLAQHLMIDGRFDDSARAAEQARQVARATGREALAELGHATCTLGVDVAYDGQLERGLRLLEEATALAWETHRLDDLMRAFANRTTLLDLDSRRVEALDVVNEGLAEARRGGLEGVYGGFLRGNAADILYMLGRWPESEEECRAALEWTPAGVAWFTPTLFLSLLLTESRADDEASRVVGQTLLQLETVPAGQWTGVMHRAAVSLALWRGELGDGLAIAGREWPRVLETDDASQIAMAASTTLEACAAVAEDARARRDYAAVADAGGIAADVLRATDERLAASELPPTLGARREAELHLDTARAHEARRRGRSDPRAWARIAEAWISRSVPYFAAKARWWEALAALQARDQRTRARDALAEAWQLAAALPARPLLLELSGLARRARIQLPLVEGREADEVLAAVTAAQEAGVPLAPHRRSGDEADRAAASGSDESRVAATPTSVRGLVPVGPGIRHADAVRRVTGIGPGGTSDAADRRAAAGESAGLDEYDVGGIIALASTPTGRAIGERLVARESAEQRDPFGLSPRETEVLNVLVEGRTNREIAERLYISERTVGVHVRKILSKLGVAGRTEAASLAIRLGLAPEAHSEYLARRR